MSYAVPLLGPLHASTVWMLAGFATFVCIWVLGGVGYELYLRRAQGIEEGVRFAAPNAPSTERAPSAETTARVAALSASETHSNTDVAGKVSQSQHAPLLGAVTQSSPTRSATTTNAPFAASPAVQTSTFAGTDAAHGGSPPAVAAPSQAAPVERRGVDAPTTSRPAAPSRDAVISEIKQHLGARGYRVHATLSGDAQTTTLALSCATLTRELGNQVLGSRQTREALKAAGIRIVVMINGQESWTYML
jgi:hypothetical protein